MKTISLVCFLVCFSLNVSARNFSKEFGDVNDTISIVETIITNDSNIAFVATCRTNSFNEILLVKMDTVGDTLFSKRFSYSQGIRPFSFAQCTVDSSFFIVSGYDSTSSILKIDKNGQFLWQKNYSVPDSAFGFGEMKIKADTLYLLGGKRYSYNFLLKMDLNGNIINQYNFGKNATQSSSNNATISNFEIDSSFNIVFTGQEAGILNGDYSCLIFKLSSDGDTIWTNSNNLGYDRYENFVQAINGQYWIIKEYWFTGWYEFDLVRYDENGNYLNTIYLRDNFSGDYFFVNSIHSLQNGNIAVYGSTRIAKPFRLELDTLGNAVDLKLSQVTPYYGVFKGVGYNSNSELFFSLNKLVFYDFGFENCYFRDSVGVRDTESWYFPQHTYLQIEKFVSGFVSDTNRFQESAGVTLNDDCIELNIDEEKVSVVRVFPNPATEKVFFVCDASLIGNNFNLFDINSRKIISSELISNDLFELNVEKLISGIYFFNIVNDEGEIHSGKLIVNH
ncbi:MAG: T9SS type A sorting domain-containing protein [Bacteroidia bacterium]|nr:T9SS type A sorting domain-containing protein [Bacteroidia bacterium]